MLNPILHDHVVWHSNINNIQHGVILHFPKLSESTLLQMVAALPRKKKAWNFARLPSQLKARRMPKEQKLDLKDWEWNGAIDGGFIQRENNKILGVAPSQ